MEPPYVLRLDSPCLAAVWIFPPLPLGRLFNEAFFVSSISQISIYLIVIHSPNSPPCLLWSFIFLVNEMNFTSQKKSRQTVVSRGTSNRYSVKDIIFGLLSISFVAVVSWMLCKRTCSTASSSSPSKDNDSMVPSNVHVRKPTFAMVFSTGRTGTQHLSLIFGDHHTYVTHEVEDFKKKTKFVVDQEYRKLVKSADSFEKYMKPYVESRKVPFYLELMRSANKTNFFYTGHVPLAYGAGEFLFNSLKHEFEFKIVRIRRDRLNLALSLMALGPEEQDPWNPSGDTSSHRWFPRPTDAHIKLRPSKESWDSFNRFQKYLWYIDDCECRWQYFKNSFSFPYIEVQFEAFDQMNSGEEYGRLSKFLNISIDATKMNQRHNSIQEKQKVKLQYDESVIRKWDLEYKDSVGNCWMGPGQMVSW